MRNNQLLTILIVSLFCLGFVYFGCKLFDFTIVDVSNYLKNINYKTF